MSQTYYTVTQYLLLESASTKFCLCALNVTINCFLINCITPHPINVPHVWKIIIVYP